MMIATMAAALPMMAGVSAPRYLATTYCVTTDTPPTHSDSTTFFSHACRRWSVSMRMIRGRMKNSGDSCSTA